MRLAELNAHKRGCNNDCTCNDTVANYFGGLLVMCISSKYGRALRREFFRISCMLCQEYLVSLFARTLAIPYLVWNARGAIPSLQVDNLNDYMDFCFYKVCFSSIKQCQQRSAIFSNIS